MFETMLGICWCLIGQCVESGLDLCCSDDDGDDAEDVDVAEKGVLLGHDDDNDDNYNDDDNDEEECGKNDGQGDHKEHLEANEQPRDRISFSGLVIHNTSIVDAVPGTLGVLSEDNVPSAPPLPPAVGRGLRREREREQA